MLGIKVPTDNAINYSIAKDAVNEFSSNAPLELLLLLLSRHINEDYLEVGLCNREINFGIESYAERITGLGHKFNNKKRFKKGKNMLAANRDKEPLTDEQIE